MAEKADGRRFRGQSAAETVTKDSRFRPGIRRLRSNDPVAYGIEPQPIWLLPASAICYESYAHGALRDPQSLNQKVTKDSNALRSFGWRV